MNPQRWHEVRALFESACDLDPAQREALLSEACAGDSNLRAEVESILASSEQAPAFFKTPAADAFPEIFGGAGAPSRVGLRVGPYKLVRFIASGGMGTVYLATRDDGKPPQTAAIKFIKRRMDRNDTLRRFRTEYSSLARLDHPNIAKLLDSGVTEDGLPYLVMEFIDGQPVDRYCDEHRLPTERRLALFRTVCSAVQYAHQNLVVHRDLKPSNILVTAAGDPVLLDFGIAKILDPQGAGASAEPTVTAQRIMTPQYASPEQIRGESITTASDVYALGVILYELLTGHRPYRIKTGLPHEIERAVCEEDPDRPSSAIRRVEQKTDGNGNTRTTLTPESVSRTRDGAPDRLSRRLAGDLDAIVLRALRKEADRRYASVEQFSEDLRRHLAGLPVIARRDTLRYRLAKFVRRNKAAVIAATLAVVCLAVVTVWITWQSRVITWQSRVVLQERDRAESVSAFLHRMLASADLDTSRGRDLAVREVLDAAAREIDEGSLDGQPAVEAAVRSTIGLTYLGLRLLDEAEPHLRAALEIRKRELGDRHLDVAESLNNLGLLAKAMGNYQEAARLYREALGLRRDMLGGEDILVAEIMNNLGVSLKKLGRLDDAEAFYRQALDIRRRALGDRHKDVATSLTNLAAVFKNKGDYVAAEPLYREALETFRELLGEEHYRVAVCMNNLALLLRDTGRNDEAEPLLRQALAIRRKVFGNEHTGVVAGLHNLALILAGKGEAAEAESLYREALALSRKLLGTDHPHVANIANNLADLLVGQGELDAAEALCREALEIRRRRLPADHPSTAGSLRLMGRIRLAKDDATGAEPLLREALAVYEKALPADHGKTLAARSDLAICLVARDRFEEAEGLLLDVYEKTQNTPGQGRPAPRETLERIIGLYRAWDKPEKTALYEQHLSELTDDR